jgi:thioesterase domain-containing protein
MIREIQAAGPYRLAGWGVGGLLAYEIAAQMIGQDEEIEYLGLIDAEYAADLHEVIDCGQSRAVRCGSFEASPGAALSTEQARAVSDYAIQPLPITAHVYVVADDAAADDARDSCLRWDRLVANRQIHTVREAGGRAQASTHAGTIAALGAAMSSALAGAAARRRDGPERAYRALVTIQTSRSRDDRILCFPGAGSGVTDFVSFGEALGEWTVEGFQEGFQARGLDGRLAPHTTVEAAATAYARCVEEALRDGPVHLVGHSFGGLVAFETALRLQLAGRRIESLTLIDSEAPGTGGRDGEYTMTEALLRFVENVELAAGAPLGIAAAVAEASTFDGKLAVVHDAMVRTRLVSQRAPRDVLRGPLRVFSAAIRARYEPAGRYGGRTNLVLAADPKLDGPANRREHDATVCAWRRWAENLTSWEAPGNHVTVLRHPNVRVLASAWSNDIAVAESGKRIVDSI